MTGKLLRDSGGTTVLSQAQVLPSGRAQSALNEHHIKRTRYVHQLSVMYLHLLKHTAYSAYCSAVHGTAEPQQVWEQLSRTENTQFKYWPTITELELLMCRFIRSLREGQFPLYSVCPSMWWALCMVSCAGPHKLCKMVVSSYAGYVSAVWDTYGYTRQISERQFCCPKITTQV